MKKLFVSAGLIAAGAASISSVSAQALDIVSPKAWSVSGTLRGFYDDNYNISAKTKGSAGLEVSPSISYNLPLQQSDMGIRYTYGLYYYQDRQDLNLNPFDQSHQLDLWLDHAINERWHLNFTDTFAVGQEPELLAGPSATLPNGEEFRVEGDNIANHAKISVDTQWTRLFGTSLHYANDFYDYDNSGAITTTNFPAGPFNTLPDNTPGSAGLFPGNIIPSLAGILNRVEQNLGLDLNWTLAPTTKVFVGYSFGLVNYTGGEKIAVLDYFTPTLGPRHLVYHSDSRDSLSHNVYAGLDYQLTSNLSFQGSVGAEYTDNYNSPLGDSSTSVSPTANISLTYTYLPGSYVQVGLTQGENATDVVQPSAKGSLTDYQNSTAVFADINHHITQKLVGTVIGRYVYSTYQGGAFSDDARTGHPGDTGNAQDNEFNLGVNLSYQITRHFSAEMGYNYDSLQSDVPGQGFSRNRVYIGMGANY